jgi:hypothetical protein
MLAEVFNLSLEAGDAETAAVDKQNRFACTVNFVIQLDSVVRERTPRSRIRTVPNSSLPLQRRDKTKRE